MRYVAGIDGGQTATKAVIVDERGRVAGSASAGPADHVNEPSGSRKCADAVAAAVAAALTAARLAPDTRLDAAVVGLSGYDSDFDGAPLRLNARTVALLHDAPIALAGAVQSRPAIIAIAGTGSVAYGEKADGTALRVGGWGHLFGDAGSAFAIARDALAHAMAEDDRGLVSPLGQAAVSFFDRASLRQVATLAGLGRISRAELAGFARVVQHAARVGDPGAAAVVGRAADALAELVVVAAARLAPGGEPIAVALTGGVAVGETFGAQAVAQIVDLVPNARVTAPRYEPAIGAALLAFAAAGLAVPAAVVQ